ncbi:hypothetical protein Bhyg_05585, partial [Pseudolycoriella hygida]
TVCFQKNRISKMVYEFEYSRPSTYRPRHYTSYTTPWYRYPSSFTANIRRPYRYNFDYRYDIPDYRYRSYSITIPKVFPSIWTEADRHSFSRRLTNDIIDSRASSVPRFVRASSMESDNDYYNTVFRARRVVALCVARSLNDETVPVLVKQDDAVVEPNNSEQVKAQEVIAAEDIVDESVQSLLENIESFDDGTEEGVDKTKGFFARFTSTTSTTGRPFLTLVLGLNTDALPMGSTMVMNSSTE